MITQWDCYSSRNPGQRGRKYRKIARMVERMKRTNGTLPPPSKMEAEWRRGEREREIEILQIQQEREQEYFDLGKLTPGEIKTGILLPP